MMALSDRLRSVRVCCGDWSRVCNSPSTTVWIGLTGIFLDPPYPRRTESGRRDGDLYATDRGGDKSPEQLRDEILVYCLEHGPDTLMRIAVCGYAGDGYEALEPKGWSVVAWKPNGGYGNRRKGGTKNKDRERIWFSPHCLRAGLFE
jgi:DNA adenine methylase